MPRKLAKTVRIFVEIDHIENRGVTFWPERIGLVFSTLWNGHEFSHGFATEIVTVFDFLPPRAQSFRQFLNGNASGSCFSPTLAFLFGQLPAHPVIRVFFL